VVDDFPKYHVKSLLGDFNTKLGREDIHNYTRTSPDGKTYNQIVHILIDRKWHSSILDV
jgi:hypothetical protein